MATNSFLSSFRFILSSFKWWAAVSLLPPAEDELLRFVKALKALERRGIGFIPKLLVQKSLF